MRWLPTLILVLVTVLTWAYCAPKDKYTPLKPGAYRADQEPR